MIARNNVIINNIYDNNLKYIDYNLKYNNIISTIK